MGGGAKRARSDLDENSQFKQSTTLLQNHFYARTSVGETFL